MIRLHNREGHEFSRAVNANIVEPASQCAETLAFGGAGAPAREKSAMAPKWKVWHHREGPGVRGRGKTTNACTTVEEWPFQGHVKHME
jgi:hypothetical protein